MAVNNTTISQKNDASLLRQKTTNVQNIGGGNDTTFNIFNTTEQEHEHYLNTLGKVELVTDSNGNAAGIEAIREKRKQKYKDYRVRLGIAPIMSAKYAQIQYTKLGASGGRTNDVKTRDYGFLRYLTETGGIVFPYTPRISINRDVTYSRIDVLQNNYSMFSYNGTPSKNINITGKFTATTPAEALYMTAVLCCLSAWTKSETGLKTIVYTSEDASLGRLKDGMPRGIPGMPPPPLYLSAYGQMIEYETPVLIQNVNYVLEDDIQYTDIVIDPYEWSLVLDTYSGRTIDTIEVRVPSALTINISLAVAPNPKRMRGFTNADGSWTGWNTTDYKNGVLFKNYNSGWTL